MPLLPRPRADCCVLGLATGRAAAAVRLGTLPSPSVLPNSASVGCTAAPASSCWLLFGSIAARLASRREKKRPLIPPNFAVGCAAAVCCQGVVRARPRPRSRPRARDPHVHASPAQSSPGPGPGPGPGDHAHWPGVGRFTCQKTRIACNRCLELAGEHARARPRSRPRARDPLE